MFQTIKLAFNMHAVPLFKILFLKDYEYQIFLKKFAGTNLCKKNK